MLSRTVKDILFKSVLGANQIPHSHLSKMPKKTGKSSSSGSSKTTSKEGGGSETKSPIAIGKDGNISISIQVKPGAKQDTITDISDTSVGVQISAPPMDGEANTAIVKYFAELLKVKKADVSLKGGKSRQKTIIVASSTGLTANGIIALLNSEMNQR